MLVCSLSESVSVSAGPASTICVLVDERTVLLSSLQRSSPFARLQEIALQGCQHLATNTLHSLKKLGYALPLMRFKQFSWLLGTHKDTPNCPAIALLHICREAAPCRQLSCNSTVSIDETSVVTMKARERISIQTRINPHSPSDSARFAIGMACSWTAHYVPSISTPELPCCGSPG